MTRAQLALLDHLGINKLYASVGSSMGGMQSLSLAYLAPERVGRVASISACGRAGLGGVGMRYAQRSGESHANTGVGRWADLKRSTELGRAPYSPELMISPHGGSQLESRFLLRRRSAAQRHEAGEADCHHHVPIGTRVGTALRPADVE